MSRISLAVFVLIALGGTRAVRAGEVWVVTGTGRSVKVVDTASESVIATIPLTQGAGAPPASGIAFATVEGQSGAFAFVGQGSLLHVVKASTRSVQKTWDLAALAGAPLTLVDLESSPNRAFTTGGGPEVRAHLLAVADAPRTGNPSPEPYWMALDQRALLELTPSPEIVAGQGYLRDASLPAADRGRASGISVMGSARGDDFVRVWLTARVPGEIERMTATLLTKAKALDAPWTVKRTQERSLPAGRPAPERFSIAVPHDGEAQVFPTGAAGSLVDLGHGGSCALPANLTAVAVRGPGAGGYEIVAIDADANDLVHVNESTCAFERFPVGQGPVDLSVDALYHHGSTWVANRDSDDVTVVRLDGTVNRVPLATPQAGSCTECPVSIEVRVGAGRGCTATSLRLAKNGVLVDLEWQGDGCSGAGYPVFCQCDRRFGNDCSCACDPQKDALCFGSKPILGDPNVLAGTSGAQGPLTRHLPFPDLEAFPPEPVIQLGATVDPRGGDNGGDGGVWIGTHPPP